jgi:heme oxygenase (biliverdin-IX-beta and delta-forming)
MTRDATDTTHTGKSLPSSSVATLEPAVTEQTAAESDPLADVASGIISHMNTDHVDALRLYCKAYAHIEADEAVMTSVDRLGFRMRVQTGDHVQEIRLAFPRAVHSAQEVRTVLVAMVQEARTKG